ncbi:hypothetical protein ACIQJT_32820 [Streptomyces sp. NPDC091972]|uniref:hypothetical protein n=1 Tax=Streptomyces sp. NPDC091972 TaxID=3366007 RepID=UPI0037F4F6C6
MTFQINHLAPFLLTRLLMDSLLTSGASVIQTSSVGARMASRIDTEDLNLDRHLGPICVYGIAKLENILFTGELHRRYQAQGLSAAAFQPGDVTSSFGAGSESRLIQGPRHQPLEPGHADLFGGCGAADVPRRRAVGRRLGPESTTRRRSRHVPTSRPMPIWHAVCGNARRICWAEGCCAASPCSTSVTSTPLPDWLEQLTDTGLPARPA